MEKIILAECIIPCVDIWPPGKLTHPRMQAYRQMQDDGQIARISVVYSKDSGHTIIQYMSSIPHDWTLQELKRIAADIAAKE